MILLGRQVGLAPDGSSASNVPNEVARTDLMNHHQLLAPVVSEASQNSGTTLATVTEAPQSVENPLHPTNSAPESNETKGRAASKAQKHLSLQLKPMPRRG